MRKKAWIVLLGSLIVMLMMPVMFTSVASANVNELSNESFSSKIDGILGSGKSVFLFLYVDWCHFCQRQMPIIDELEQEYAEKISFIRINCEEQPQALKEFWARGYPSMFLIMGKGNDGKYKSQYSRGFTDKETLKKSIDWIIANGSINENSKDNELGIGASPTLLVDDEDYTVALAGAASAYLESSVCPSSPPGVLPRGEGCRGACGPGCPDGVFPDPSCVDLPDIFICGTETGGIHFVCKYTGVIKCKTYEVCRCHDNCYDACREKGVDCPNPLKLCCLSCDWICCLSTYSTLECALFAAGLHPYYDGYITYANEPILIPCEEPTPYCVNGKCVECRTNADCDDKDGWYPDGANAEEYRDYRCSDDKECVFDVTDHRCNAGYKNCDGVWSNGCECPPDMWCDEGECVPEASTLVLVAVGLLCLAGYVRLLRRKTK
jgi:thiol-disulfide isomerase/thioredoxin